jgi:hypothetical protein
MLHKFLAAIATTAALTLTMSTTPSALAQGMKWHKRQFVTSYSTSGDVGQSRPGRITGIAVDPPDPMRGGRVMAQTPRWRASQPGSTGVQTTNLLQYFKLAPAHSGSRHYLGPVNRFSAGPRRRGW